MKTLHRPWPAGGLRRRYSTKEYFQRNLKSVDALCAHNSGGSQLLATAQLWKSSNRHPASKKRTTKFSRSMPNKTPSRPPPSSWGWASPTPLNSRGAHNPTRAFITETLDANTQLSSSRSSPSAKPPAPTFSQSHPPHAHPNPPVQKTTSGTILAALAAHLDRPHSPNPAATTTPIASQEV
ncbi:hypothetical protein PTTG_25218 [Puccinia triticina 1-1 BBBD Race 1]|uniref:Uncharacterized protein n=1 Tax=Puccinia triticina (isolate 1-1 / race 1 (BBBD)) TaxID=630390 RepID=A0A180H3L1_PUCT1|nr:hypothetical protein PTTG_25218 [Puccinia triticina 1-1 BBBD Race 1]